MTFQPIAVAERLIAAHQSASTLPWATVCPPNLRSAYAVQDATVSALGPIGGWKVGAKGPEAEPICAPLPASRLLASGANLTGPHWRLRGVEVEVGLRVRHDLDRLTSDLTSAELTDAFDAVLPVIEVVETRLDDWETSAPLAKLADLQSHGTLLLGSPVPLPVGPFDLKTVEAELDFDDHTVVRTRGGNPAADLWRILGWLVKHCAGRGAPLRRGQIITTGSCTGMLFANRGTRVTARLTGLGRVEVRF
jgi:2-keto-4-pentenoate hydratase